MNSGSLRNQAYEKIRGKLVLGRLSAGSQISEPMLAKMLGIGRTPVREAIQQLQVEGLVERTPRRGTVVRVPERRDIVDLYELREGLESFAVTLATKRIRPDDISVLQGLCDQISTIAEELEKTGERSLDGSMMRQFLAADMGFHMLLIRATGNERIMKIVGDSHVMSRIFGTARQEHNLEIVQETYVLHSQILGAVEDGDEAKARDSMVAHIRQSLKESLHHFDYQLDDGEDNDDVLRRLQMPFELLEEFGRMELGIEEDRGDSRAHGDHEDSDPE